MYRLLEGPLHDASVQAIEATAPGLDSGVRSRCGYRSRFGCVLGVCLHDRRVMNSVGSTSEMAAMGADAGMVAIAVLMLASGLIMTVGREMMAMDG